MSSNDEDGYEGEPKDKTKRVSRACDTCRRKKRRCDGGEPCGHCQKHDFVCTYIEPSNPKSVTHDPSESKAYIAALEARLKTVEEMLRKVRQAKSPGVQLVTNAIQRLNSPFPEPHSDDLAFIDVENSFRALSIDHPAAQGFQGKSSGAMLVKAAVDLRKRVNGGAIPLPVAFPEPTKTWENLAADAVPNYSFPEDDLLSTLITLYFKNVNEFLPTIHRPTFLTAIAQRFHLRHSGFAKTVLLVCAVAARYSSDPRVSLTDVPVSAAETAGWKWFDQVELSGHLVRTNPTLYDLQSYCLAAEFLDCTSSPRTCWTLVGFGMRLSQDMGAHRYKTHKGVISFEQEMEKRASWVLFLFEAQISTALGRTIALQSHDFDIQTPLVVDDEYWGSPEDPSVPLFRQPDHQPSRLAYFVCMLQLNRILSFSCKILYSTNRSKALIGLGDDKWEEQVVVELDSTLNKWFETLPEHLRWDPEHPIEDDTFFDQSAVLYCTYYHTRIIIHRPFIPAMRRASNPTHVPSLAICNTAARACSHVAQIQQKRRPNNPIWFSQTPLFTSGIVLLLNIWGGAGGSAPARLKAAEADMVDVHRCMAVLEVQKQVWPSAGALLNTLKQLVAVDHPLAPSSGPQHAPLVEVQAAPEPPNMGNYHAPLTEPPYDPHLETAPPEAFSYSEYMDGGIDAGSEWQHDYAAAVGSDFNLEMYAGPQDVHMGSDYITPAGMDVDTQYTIDLWARAPNGFGVSDWDVYLASFVDGVAVGSGVDGYSM